MTDIERLMQDTLCPKKRAEGVLRGSRKKYKIPAETRC